MFRCPAELSGRASRTGRLYGHHRGAPRATRPSRGRSRSPEKVRSAPAPRQTQEPVLGDPEPRFGPGTELPLRGMTTRAAATASRRVGDSDQRSPALAGNVGAGRAGTVLMISLLSMPWR